MSIQQQPAYPGKRGWWAAFKLFLHSPESGPFVKTIVPLFAAGLPVNMFDDLVPLVGQLDDPVLPLNALSAVWLIWKVNKYRRIR